MILLILLKCFKRFRNLKNLSLNIDLFEVCYLFLTRNCQRVHKTVFYTEISACFGIENLQLVFESLRLLDFLFEIVMILINI